MNPEHDGFIVMRSGETSAFCLTRQCCTGQNAGVSPLRRQKSRLRAESSGAHGPTVQADEEMFQAAGYGNFVHTHQMGRLVAGLPCENYVLSCVGNDSTVAGFKLLPVRLSSQARMNGSSLKICRR